MPTTNLNDKQEQGALLRSLDPKQLKKIKDMVEIMVQTHTNFDPDLKSDDVKI